MAKKECIFCKIANENTSNLLANRKHSVAFNDLNPKADIHILVVPKKHYKDIVDVATNDKDVLQDMILLANDIAKTKIAHSEFRLIFNTGAHAGQSVFHAHAHIIGNNKKNCNKSLAWNPA
jgi:histidine triad (HIT) family protein